MSFLITKKSSLPPLPVKLEEALTVENRRPSQRADHGIIQVRYEAPSGRGVGFSCDRMQLQLHGGDNGFITLRGLLSSNLLGKPSESADTFVVSLPVDLLRPFLAGLERGAELLIEHEKEAERQLARRGAVPEGLSHGWSWF